MNLQVMFSTDAYASPETYYLGLFIITIDILPAHDDYSSFTKLHIRVDVHFYTFHLLRRPFYYS